MVLNVKMFSGGDYFLQNKETVVCSLILFPPTLYPSTIQPLHQRSYHLLFLPFAPKALWFVCYMKRKAKLELERGERRKEGKEGRGRNEMREERRNERRNERRGRNEGRYLQRRGES